MAEAMLEKQSALAAVKQIIDEPFETIKNVEQEDEDDLPLI